MAMKHRLALLVSLTGVTLMASSTILVSIADARGGRGGGGGGNINSGNRNTNISRNTNVNIDNDWDGGWGGGWGGYRGYGYGAGVIAGAAVGAAIVGSYYSALPSGCASVYRVGNPYYQCGSAWYQPVYSGSTVQYVVVDAP